MGSYSNRNHLISEANTGSSTSHFPWFYPGSYFSFPKTCSNLTQGTQANPMQGFTPAPVQSIPPMKESGNHVKTGKRKSSAKVPNHNISKSLKPKPPKKNPSPKNPKKAPSIPEAKREKKNPDINIDISSFDFTGVPSPLCSCTGISRVCYKWGAGGWQSSCCTINISEYPLPMSTTRPGARLAGRKMSNGAYVKLLLRLAGEGYDLSRPVDLKNHWARHGTNKFVTIK